MTFINNLNKKKNNDFKAIENEIKKDENELISKKNIIEESIYNKKVNEIRLRINNYKLERQKFNKNLNISPTTKQISKLISRLDKKVKQAINIAYNRIHKFHSLQK